MAEEETRQKREEESESEEEEDDVVETIPKVEIDPSKLTPLSPEVISKQVSAGIIYFIVVCLMYQCNRPLLIWVIRISNDHGLYYI